MEKNKLLDGIKVVDFGWIAVAPVTARYLGDMGATVIKVETHTRMDTGRLSSPNKDNQVGIDNSGWFAQWNSSKLGITVDLTKPKGKEVGERIIKWADVAIEGFLPGVMNRFGLDYDAARKIKPDIIYLSASQFGQTGPHATFTGFGHMLVGMTGISQLTGFPDQIPTPPFGAYGDCIAWRFCVASLLAALDYRRRTGKGQHIDLSQLEAGLYFLGPALMDYLVNGRIWNRNGNRCPYAAPHGVYRCKGDEQWIAITVGSDNEWRSFCRVIDQSAWTKDPKFATLLDRKENEDELDRLVEDWTINHAPEEVGALMQAAGVPASVVESVKHLVEDPQLIHRGFFRRLGHKVLGDFGYHAPAYKLSKSPDSMYPSPCMGEHNLYVFEDILGYSRDEIADMVADSTITGEADIKMVP